MSKIYAIGTGPGDPGCMTLDAHAALARCNVVVGYKLYLEMLGELLDGKRLIPGAMYGEVERCQAAINEAQAGNTVAVISNGDAGIYGMAGLLLELMTESGCEVDFEVVPGVTSVLAAAARLGAPLMCDFTVLSLSDLLMPRELILKRAAAAAGADMVTALYNPASKRRVELLKEVLELFNRHGGGDLPIALADNIAREGEKCQIYRLSEFPTAEVGMSSLVIIGNSQTMVVNSRMYAKRGYFK